MELRTHSGTESPPFWSLTSDELLRRLETARQGLTGEEAQQRLTRFGAHL